MQDIFEIKVAAQENQIGIGFISVADIAQEPAADDAAFAPKQGGVAVVQFPAVGLARFAYQHKTLGVRNNFGCQQGQTEGFQPFRTVARHCFGGMAEQCGGSFALLLKGGNAAGENGFGNQSQRNAQIQSVDACPFAGAFLSGGIEYLVYQRQAV